MQGPNCKQPNYPKTEKQLNETQFIHMAQSYEIITVSFEAISIKKNAILRRKKRRTNNKYYEWYHGDGINSTLKIFFCLGS